MAVADEQTLDPSMPPENVVRSPLMRAVLFVSACTMVIVGVIGIFLPGLPTTVFLLAAAWCFSRSSARFQRWLWYHPRLGRPVRDWYAYRVIPVRAKIVAVLMMGLSLAYVAYAVPEPWAWQVLALILVPAAVYIVTRSSTRPTQH
ncbi:MAG: YbaN family protein [Rhodospirillales bacterium]